MISLILAILSMFGLGGIEPGISLEGVRDGLTPRERPNGYPPIHVPPGFTKCDRWQLYHPGEECPW